MTDSCDKMSKIFDMTLPGDLCIPVSLIVETFLPYKQVEHLQTEDEVYGDLKDYVRQQVHKDMAAGVISSESWNILEADGCFRLYGVLECHEMIAASVEVAWDKGGVILDREDR